jgi:DNA-binding NarL/FixJ family response regulator
MLTALGASDAEDRVYRYLATTVSVTDEEIRRATGLPLDDIHEALKSLEERGLLGTTDDIPMRYVAASPGAVEAMIANQLRELRDAQGTLDRLTTKYRAEHLARESGSAFEIIRGQEALRQRSIHMLHSARIEVLNMIKPPIIAVQSQDRVVPGDGVGGRLIFETSSLEAPDALDAVQAGMRARSIDEVRVHTKLPAKMLITDRALALVPLAQRDTTPVGVLVHPSVLLDSLVALFEYVWASSARLYVDNAESRPPDADSPLSAEDRRLLSLLLSGLTDEAIAAHFHVSVRTIQRKVHNLMEAANVRTRMQLAWEAARRSWV